MPDLYIANCTRQTQIVAFRKDFTPKGQPRGNVPPTSREIAPGQQVRVLKSESIDLVTSVTEQLEPYGLTPVADISRVGNRASVPYIYNVDRQVTRAQIMTVMDHNTGVKLIEGKERRQRAAVASNDIVTSTVANELARRGLPDEAIPDTTQTTVEFEQLEQSEAGESRIEEGVHVRADAPTTKPAATNKSGNRRGMRKS